MIWSSKRIFYDLQINSGRFARLNFSKSKNCSLLNQIFHDFKYCQKLDKNNMLFQIERFSILKIVHSFFDMLEKPKMVTIFIDIYNKMLAPYLWTKTHVVPGCKSEFELSLNSHDKTNQANITSSKLY